MAVKNESNYKEMMDTIKQMEETAEMLKSLTYNQLEDEGYNTKALEKFTTEVGKADISMQPNDALVEIFKSIGIEDEEKIRKICRNFCEVKEAKEAIDENGEVIPETQEETDARLEKFDNAWEDSKYSWMKRVLLQLFDDMAEVTKTYDEVDKLKKEADNAISEYVNYLSSEEYQKKKFERIKALKQKAEKSDDPIEKKKVSKLCDELESSLTLSFIADSIERLGDKGYENIKDCFLNASKSNYVMKKYHEKIEKFGYKDEVYGYLFGIEEKFLEEKYWVYNNLFLFFMMRFIGNADPYTKRDKLYVSSLITNAANLVYQKFVSEEAKEHYVDVIRNFLDHFEKYHDLFDKENALHPNHPQRIARKEKQDNSLKEMIYANLEDSGYEVTDEVRAMDIQELRVLYDEVLNDLEKKKESQSPIGQIIEKCHLNTDIYKREELRKRYLKVSDIDDEAEEKFKSLPLEELKEFVDNTIKEFESKVCEGEDTDEAESEDSDNSENK